jgi:hypothetical protein
MQKDSWVVAGPGGAALEGEFRPGAIGRGEDRGPTAEAVPAHLVAEGLGPELFGPAHVGHAQGDHADGHHDQSLPSPPGLHHPSLPATDVNCLGGGRVDRFR